VLVLYQRSTSTVLVQCQGTALQRFRQPRSLQVDDKAVQTPFEGNARVLLSFPEVQKAATGWTHAVKAVHKRVMQLQQREQQLSM
jgi:hypothetical protein